jgi:hypothetical protein
MAPPPPKRHGPLYWIAVVIGVIVLIVVVVVVIAAVLFVSVGGANTVAVTGINTISSDNACGANGGTASGFTTQGGGEVQYTLTMSGGIFLSCTVNSVSATTPGFTISGANTPLTIPADGSADLSFTIHAPSSSFSGVLTIDIE